MKNFMILFAAIALAALASCSSRLDDNRWYDKPTDGKESEASDTSDTSDDTGNTETDTGSDTGSDTGTDTGSDTGSDTGDSDTSDTEPAEEDIVNPSDEDITPEPDQDVTPEPDEDITPEPDQDVTPEPDEDVTPEPDQDVTPEPDEDIIPEPDQDVTPEPDEDIIPEPDQDVTPEPDEDIIPEPDQDVTPEPDEDIIPEPDQDVTPEPDEDIIPEPDEDTCVPNCADKQCGYDGCDGTCGECGTDEFCNYEFKCVTSECSEITLDTTLELYQANSSSVTFKTSYEPDTGNAGKDTLYIKLLELKNFGGTTWGWATSGEPKQFSLVNTNYNDNKGLLMYIYEDDGNKKYFQREGTVDVTYKYYHGLIPIVYYDDVTAALTGVILEEVTIDDSNNSTPVSNGACLRVKDNTKVNYYNEDGW